MKINLRVDDWDNGAEHFPAHFFFFFFFLAKHYGCITPTMVLKSGGEVDDLLHMVKL